MKHLLLAFILLAVTTAGKGQKDLSQGYVFYYEKGVPPNTTIISVTRWSNGVVDIRGDSLSVLKLVLYELEKRNKQHFEDILIMSKTSDRKYWKKQNELIMEARVALDKR